MKNDLFFVLLFILICVIGACIYLAFIRPHTLSPENSPAPQPSQERQPGPVANPAPPVSGAQEPKWEVAYQDDFSQPDCVQRYVVPEGALTYHDNHKALLLRADPGKQAYAVVQKSFPGDLRVRFKALRRKQVAEVSLGLLFSCRGPLKDGDGYFAEWARGVAQIKKQKSLQQSASAPTPPTPDRWVNLELRRVGPKITMLLEGKEVLAWTDPAPLAGPDHGELSFYVRGEITLIRDLVIEQKAN